MKNLAFEDGVYLRFRCLCATALKKGPLLPVGKVISHWLIAAVPLCLMSGMGLPTCESD
jgi:hypothetical protein